MPYLSSRTRFKSLQRVFEQGGSALLDSLVQLSVLYEDLRIETFALTADGEELKRLDYLDKRYRVHYFLRRSVATLIEFKGALVRASRTTEFKARQALCLHPDASLTRTSQAELFKRVSDARTFFEKHHDELNSLRNAVGGHFSDKAAHRATANVHPNAVGTLEITFDKSGRGGGARLHYAGEIAATAFVGHLPGIKPRQEEIEDAICMIRDGYAYLTKAMHALVALFLWDRFG